MTGLDHQHLVAGRKHVGQRTFPSAVSVRSVVKQMLFRFQNLLGLFVYTSKDRFELRRQEVDRGAVHRA